MSNPEPRVMGRPEGTCTYLPRPDSRDDEVWDEVWAEDAYKFAGGQVRFCGTVVDIGANVGAFTLLAAVSGAKRVIAVEPDPANMDALRMSMTHNEVGFGPTIETIEAGVWYRDGRGNITAKPGTPDAVVGEDDERGTVQLYSLDTIWREWQIQGADILKVDVEGSEANVIAGASDEVLWSVRRLVMEWHGEEMLEDRGGIDLDSQAKMMLRLRDMFRLEIVGRNAQGGLLVGDRY